VKERISYRVILLILLTAVMLVMLFPILWILLTSIKPLREIVTVPVKYFPTKVTVVNYISMWAETNYLRYFRNSSVVCLSAALITLTLSSAAGYAFARFQFRLKYVIVGVFLITQMIPVVVTLIPTFVIFARLGLINTLPALIVYYTTGSIPFCAMLMRGFFMRIPESLEEAAMVDGCTRLRAFIVIVMPLMRAGVFATFVFAFIGGWNDFFASIMYVNKESLRTLPSGLYSFVTKYGVDWGMMSAGCIVALVPVVVLFTLSQRYIIEGLTSGAVKA
jgi:multiple sugar transport system permease protein